MYCLLGGYAGGVQLSEGGACFVLHGVRRERVE